MEPEAYWQLYSWRRTVGALGAGLCLAVFGPSAARAELHGLQIGIDRYEHGNSLEGAVNDAQDIADALRTAGATDVQVLLDGAASRDAILKAWNDLIARAAPGDTLVISYAGHGSQQPEAVPGTEEDGKDEFFLMGGFSPSGPGTYERILDNEVNLLLKKSSAFHVVFIADACHSGTMTRAWDSRASKPKVRYYDYGEIKDDRLPPPDPAAATLRAADLPHVTFFAGVTDDKEVPEVKIDGHSRGALSWSVAEGLRGKADTNGDGTVTKGELEAFVLENVRMRTNYVQQAVVAPAGDADRPIVVRPGSAAAAPAAPAPAEPAVALLPLPSLALYALNGSGPAFEGTLARLEHVTPAAERDDADLIWDVTSGDIILTSGDVVAHVQPMTADTRAWGRTGALPAGQAAQGAATPPQRFDPAQVQNVLDKWSLNDRLIAASESRSLRMRTEPGNGLYHPGEKLVFTVGDQRFPYFTLFNLAADGTVNLLYPVAAYKDPLTIPTDRDFSLELEPQAPFGADHFVAITSDRPLEGLHRALAAMDGTPAAGRLAAELDRHLAGRAYRIGVHAVFTSEK